MFHVIEVTLFVPAARGGAGTDIRWVCWPQRRHVDAALLEDAFSNLYSPHNRSLLASLLPLLPNDAASCAWYPAANAKPSTISVVCFAAAYRLGAAISIRPPVGCQRRRARTFVLCTADQPQH